MIWQFSGDWAGISGLGSYKEIGVIRRLGGYQLIRPKSVNWAVIIAEKHDVKCVKRYLCNLFFPQTNVRNDWFQMTLL